MAMNAFSLSKLFTRVSAMARSRAALQLEGQGQPRLTSQVTFVHDSITRVGLESSSVFDPIGVDLRIARGLADQDNVAALFHHLHGGKLEDLGEPGGQASICNESG